MAIIRNTAGQYHASFVVEISPINIEPLRPSIGVDLGIKTFAFLSTGDRVESPGYNRLDRKTRRFQRKLARQVKGSKRRAKTRLRLAKLKLKNGQYPKRLSAQDHDPANPRKSSGGVGGSGGEEYAW